MIKKVLIGIIFLVLVAIGTFDIICVNNSLDNAIKTTNEIENMINESAPLDEIKTKADLLEKNWVKNEKAVTIFMYYRDIDTLGKQINLVKMLIDENDLENAKVEIGGLKYLLSSAKKVSEFNFDNIF